jgi:hypothetical protein
MSIPTTSKGMPMVDPHTRAGQLVQQYLHRLHRATADLPESIRVELTGDIEAHLADTLGTNPNEATTRQVLDELGSPDEIAASAATESGVSGTGHAQRGTGAVVYDVAAVLVLLAGGFVVPVAGWIAGVVMLWSGPRWQARHKWTGTLLWPAAIAVGGLALLADHAAHGHAAPVVIIAALVVLAGLIAGFAYLIRAATRPHQQP